MSCHLSKDLKTKYEVRAIPVRKGDLVKIMRGSFRTREGKVQTVYRKKWCIHVEKVTKEKTNGIFLLSHFCFRFSNLNSHSPLKLHDHLA